MGLCKLWNDSAVSIINVFTFDLLKLFKFVATGTKTPIAIFKLRNH